MALPLKRVLEFDEEIRALQRELTALDVGIHQTANLLAAKEGRRASVTEELGLATSARAAYLTRLRAEQVLRVDNEKEFSVAVRVRQLPAPPGRPDEVFVNLNRVQPRNARFNLEQRCDSNGVVAIAD